MKTYTRHELTNDEYQQNEAASGTELFTIHDTCEAVLKYAVRKPSDNLDIGEAFHLAVMEPDVFKQEVVRGFDESLYPNALKTTTDIKKHISETYGKPKGISTLTKPKLIQWLHEANDNVQIIDVMQAEFEAENADKLIIKPDQYDDVLAMASQLRSDDNMCAMLDNATVEQSYTLDIDGVPCRTRPDLIIELGDGEYGVLNLKSAIDVRADGFGKAVWNHGYLLKEAFTHDLLAKFYGRPPKWIGFLAQQKKPLSYEEYPFIWKPYYLEQWQIEAGRAMYQEALAKWQQMHETGEYPAYGTEFEPVQLPGWAKSEIFNKYGITAE